jgi:hypothetical protein
MNARVRAGQLFFELFRFELFRFELFRFELFRLAPFFFFGTFAPERRASDNPIAIACFLLFTLRPDRPDLSVPFFRFFIAPSTFFDADLLYLRPPFFFLAAMLAPFV